MDSVPAHSSGMLTDLFRAALALFGENAATAAFFGALIESLIAIGAIFPGGTIVVLSGFAARAAGGAGFVEVTLAAWLGMTLGAGADYWIGRLAGRRLVPRSAPWRLACRWRRMLRLAHGFMTRWGWWAIIIANIAGPGRSAIAAAAGASGWSFSSFMLGQSIASLAWSVLFCGVGFFAAGELESIEELMGGIGVTAAIVVACALCAPAVLATAWRFFGRPFRPTLPATLPALTDRSRPASR